MSIDDFEKETPAEAEEVERMRAVVEAAGALREDALGISEGYKDAKSMHTWRAGVAHKEVWDRFIDAVDAFDTNQKEEKHDT